MIIFSYLIYAFLCLYALWVFYLAVMTLLRDEPDLRFEELVDLCGVDYSTYGDGAWSGRRFAVVSHLMSIAHNWRLRVRVFAEDDEFPAVDRVDAGQHVGQRRFAGAVLADQRVHLAFVDVEGHVADGFRDAEGFG